MKRIFFKLTAIMLIFAGSFSACNKISELKNDSKEVNEPISLENTKWKLVGIIDVETGELQKLAPRDCEECYTLAFISDTKAEGLAFREKFVLDLNILGEYSITDIGRTNEDDFFIRILYDQNTKSYSVSLTELKFINETDKYYLLFKLIGGPNHEN